MIRSTFAAGTAGVIGLVVSCAGTDRPLGDLPQPAKGDGGPLQLDSSPGSRGNSTGGGGAAGELDGSVSRPSSGGEGPISPELDASGVEPRCAAGTFGRVAIGCAEWTNCVAGEYEKAAGTDTRDRQCSACPAGSFSTEANAMACTPWTTCSDGTVQVHAGTATSDRGCTVATEWVRQFGSPNGDGARGIAVDGAGNIYVAGVLGGRVSGGAADAGGSFDAFVQKFDATGAVVWTRQFGSSGDDAADSITVDASGNIYVAGSAGGALPGQTALGAWDVFVRKYDAAGSEKWTRQFGSSGYDTGSVAVDHGGNVYVSGLTEGGLPGQSAQGSDAGAVGYVFVRKYDGAGTEQWTRQFSSAGEQINGSANVAGSAAVDGAGNVYFAGLTDGSLPGQHSAGGEDAFVRKYDTDGTELWTRQFGTTENDGCGAVDTDSAGNVYLGGHTFGTFPGQSSAGKADAFVRKYDSSGTEQWTAEFGTSTPDGVTAIQVDGAGIVHVGGNTSGTLPGQTSAGSTDAFIRKYDATGKEMGTRQLGTADIEQGISLAVSSSALYVAGQTNGAFQPNAGDFDGFVAKLSL